MDTVKNVIFHECKEDNFFITVYGHSGLAIDLVVTENFLNKGVNVVLKDFSQKLTDALEKKKKNDPEGYKRYYKG